jgi:hypothetical protein
VIVVYAGQGGIGEQRDRHLHSDEDGNEAESLDPSP